MTDFSRNDDRHRFEATLEGHVAFTDYHEHDGQLTLLHTEVPRELEGRGVGSALVQWSLAYARENGLSVMPICPFVTNYIRRHPEWVDVVGERFRYMVG